MHLECPLPELGVALNVELLRIYQSPMLELNEQAFIWTLMNNDTFSFDDTKVQSFFVCYTMKLSYFQQDNKPIY